MHFEPGVGGRLVEVYDDEGADAYELGRVLVWEPPARLVFTMGGRDFAADDPRTEVEVFFEATEGGTRVSVHHEGWEGLGADHPVRHGLEGDAFLDMMGLWWADLLVALGRARA